MDENKKILIVDDEPNLRKTLSDILKVRGYETISIAKGKTAIKSVREEMPVVAIIDLKLEDITGLEVMKGIKGLSPNTECIIITGHGTEKAAIEAINLRAFNYIQKPYDMDQLLATIRRAVEKRDMEVRLKESEKKYRELVENTEDLIYVLDGKGNFKFLNRAGESFTGYSRKEIFSKNFLDLVAPESYKEAEEIFKRQLAGEDVGIFELQLYKKNGAVIFVETRQKLIWENHRVIEIQGIGRDITKHKRAEGQIRQQNEFLNTVMESLTHPFYIVDVRNYNVVMGNPAGRQGLAAGYSTCYRLIHNRDKPCGGVRYPCPIQTVTKSKKPITVEHIHVDKKGDRKNSEIHAFPIFNKKGEVKQIIVYIIDITERIEAQKKSVTIARVLLK